MTQDKTLVSWHCKGEKKAEDETYTRSKKMGHWRGDFLLAVGRMIIVDYDDDDDYFKLVS